MLRCIFPVMLGFTVLAVPAPSARGGKPKQVPFEEHVAKADFIGIVECETAGGIVGKYKVIESCRGAKAGEHIAIRVGVNPSGQQFPIALCGRRYFVMAYRTAPNSYSSKAVPTAFGVPLWWRKLPSDYQTPFGRGPNTSDINKYYEQAKALAAKQPAPAPAPAPTFDEVVWKAPGKEAPPKAQIDAWRALVADKGTKKDVAEAHDGLLMYDPGPLCQELVKWVPDEGHIKIPRAEIAWPKASYFAWRCGQEREKNLKLLLTAKEPIVRVAGAVYLCFEDEKAGMAELAKLIELKDEAGAWAALTLARRGKNDAIPRVLDMFRGDQGIASFRSRESHMHAALRVHALVLFSNSAQKSGVAQPAVKAVRELASAKEVAADREVLLQWWLENGVRLTLHDPWLATLSKQKID